MQRRRVVVTGLGTVNPLGNDVETTWRGLVDGASGIAPIERFDVSGYDVRFGGEVRDFDPTDWLHPKAARRLDRFCQFGVCAAIQAVTDAGVDFDSYDVFRCGVIIGSGIGGLSEFEAQYLRLLKMGPEKVSPYMIPKLMVNAASGQASIHYGLKGPNSAVATACASASNAIGEAMRAIQYGGADVMITGGAEAALTPVGLSGFCALRALSRRNDDPQRASRPFDNGRDGFVLSEGAGILVLEEAEAAVKRGARIYAELCGYGSTGDGSHITAPDPHGAAAARAMSDAIADAGLQREQVDYINAHGTGTKLGDQAETAGVKSVFGDHAHKLCVSSSKSMVGHMLGASGGVELMSVCLSITHDIIPPTINLDEPDPECDLDYVPNTARQRTCNVGMSNSFGFGGHNASLIAKKFNGKP